ncbi:MAG: ATP-dependent RNA helicase SrmB [Firmicutes bacterium ADurb.Bin419]|nr:MAG: ATP-dependent RNA helicase SrmB [Firmicutes bacterium ADurb.Bin419]
MALENKNIFNNREAVEYLVNSLSDIKLKPFPHIGVVGPNPHKQNKSTVFTDFTQIPPYIVGYKVHAKGGNGTISKSEFTFTFRKSLYDKDDSFENINVVLTTDLYSLTTRVEINNLTTGETQSENLTASKNNNRTSFEGVWSKQYKFPFEEDGTLGYKECQIDVRYKKSVYVFEDGNYYVEVKFINESEPQPVRGEVITTEADDEIPMEYVKSGYLMSISLAEELEKGEFILNSKNTAVRRLFNIVQNSISEDGKRILFKDYFIGYERILKLKSSDKVIDEFIEQHNKIHPHKIDPIISRIFKKVFKSDIARFHKYQEQGITEILSEIRTREGRAKIISVRTAGGKTETFVVPVIQYCVENIDKIGTKALVFYPTKALGNDQAKRIFKALYFANKELINQGKRKITMALYHGDVEKHSKDAIGWVPFKCVKDDCSQPLEVRSEGIQNTLYCPHCGEVYDYVCLTRDESHRRLPDVLITNPDTFTWVLSRNSERHSLLGRKIKYCTTCGVPHRSIRALKCGQQDCKGSLMAVTPQCIPELIIFDEIHLFGGAFGISVSQFLKRLNRVIRHYNCIIYSNSKNYKPVLIGSTATIKDPADFASKFFDIPYSAIDMIPLTTDSANIYEDISKSEISRYNLFILPRAYLAKQTTALAAAFLLEYAYKLGNDFKPRILGFANSLRDCNDLISETRARYNGKYSVDGHNTQYDNEERSEREVSFNKGEVNVLYATSTLEVGVDFEAMHALIIFGPPYSFNDYLQRIGRAGRNSDAVVLTVVKLNNPIDYHYYENCNYLVNNPMSNTERVPISSYNPHIEKKQVIASFFDFIQLQENIHEFDDFKYFASYFFAGSFWKRDAVKRVKEYIKSVFTIDENILEEILDELKDKIFSQADETPKKTLFDLFHHVLEQTEFTNLRSSDPAVEVEYIFGEA